MPIGRRNMLALMYILSALCIVCKNTADAKTVHEWQADFKRLIKRDGQSLKHEHGRKVNRTEILSIASSTMPPTRTEIDTASTQSTAAWVFITIGVVIGAVVLLIVSLTIYRIKRRLKRNVSHAYSKNSFKLPKPCSFQRMSSSEKDEIPTVSEGICSYSAAINDNHELVPLKREKGMPCSARGVRPLVLNRERCNSLEYTVHDFSEEQISTRELSEIPTKTNRSMAQHAPPCNIFSSMIPCLSLHDKKDDVENNVNTLSFFKLKKDDGNKLRGGNGDFDRRYVDVDYVNNEINLERDRWCYGVRNSMTQDHSLRTSRRSLPRDYDERNPETNIDRFSRERRRNESNRSSSTRRCISMKPTSPSEHYIEAGSDNISMRSERSTPPTKFAWLTKNLKLDAKNEMRSYQSSLGTQTENDNIITPTSKTVFGTPWQFGGTYNNQGGELQAENSDVCLVVTANAIPKTAYVDVYGAVFTDTAEIRKKLNFPAREFLITPVVEYHAEPVNTFNRHVCIQLPHSMPKEFHVNHIKVYTFIVDERGKVSLHVVPVLGKSNDDRTMEAYWEKAPDGHSIHISTTHFSGYFCTQCETSSLPSIMTTVFGSHVQITETRREVRVILYIWDCRLAIKDYLERFSRQESDFDRQLLIDMRVPLLNTASSDSRLVMKMEVKGDQVERRCWRHISRPGLSNPLFKPLQIRRLEEIIQCCRQTDPVRVEWALETVPQEIPSQVFQCFIDIMHAHQSIQDYEEAMNENSDDLLRTLYVQDIKIKLPQTKEISLTDLKIALVEVVSRTQIEDICKAFGFTNRDIRNMSTKYSSSEGLLEECIMRHTADKFRNQLPGILQKLQMHWILNILVEKNILVKENNAPPNVPTSQGDVAEQTKPKVPSQYETTSSRDVAKQAKAQLPITDETTKKTPYTLHETAGSGCLENRRRENEVMRGSTQQRMSQRSDKVVAAINPLPRQLEKEDYYQGRSRRHRLNSPRRNYTDDEHHGNERPNGSSYTDQIREDEQLMRDQKSSASGHDSALSNSSIPTGHPVSQSTTTASVHFPSTPQSDSSTVAHADPIDFAEALPVEFLDDCLQQTYKKEPFKPTNNHGFYPSENYMVCQDQLHLSDSGPRAMPPESGQISSSSLSYPIPPHRKSEKRPSEKSLSQDKDQTKKKELYGTAV